MSVELPDEYTQVTTTVFAGPDACHAVAIDLPSYPQWAEGISAVEVLDQDADGRPTRARFVAEAVGRRTEYTLVYDHSAAPTGVSWRQERGDITRRLDGTYRFRPTGETTADGTGITEVTYELAIDLALPLPGFVKRRVETKIVHAALEGFCREIARRS